MICLLEEENKISTQLEINYLSNPTKFSFTAKTLSLSDKRSKTGCLKLAGKKTKWHLYLVKAQM